MKRQEELKKELKRIMGNEEGTTELQRSINGLRSCTAMMLAQYADKTMVDHTVSWLYEQLNNGRIECGDMEKFVQDYRAAMEECPCESADGSC